MGRAYVLENGTKTIGIARFSSRLHKFFSRRFPLFMFLQWPPIAPSLQVSVGSWSALADLINFFKCRMCIDAIFRNERNLHAFRD